MRILSNLLAVFILLAVTMAYVLHGGLLTRLSTRVNQTDTHVDSILGSRLNGDPSRKLDAIRKVQAVMNAMPLSKGVNHKLSMINLLRGNMGLLGKKYLQNALGSVPACHVAIDEDEHHPMLLRIRQIICQLDKIMSTPSTAPKSDYCPNSQFLSATRPHPMNNPITNPLLELARLHLVACNMHHILISQNQKLVDCYPETISNRNFLYFVRQSTMRATPILGGQSTRLYCRMLNEESVKENFAFQSDKGIRFTGEQKKYIRDTAQKIKEALKMLRENNITEILRCGDDQMVYHSTLHLLGMISNMLDDVISGDLQLSFSARWYMLDMVEYIRMFIPRGINLVITIMLRVVYGC